MGGKRIVILGAGGAARAISVECAGGGCSVDDYQPDGGKRQRTGRVDCKKTSCAAEFVHWTER